MSQTQISVALAAGHDNALSLKSDGLFAPKHHGGVKVVGTGHHRGTLPKAPHFHVEIPVAGAEGGDYAVLNTDINKEGDAQWLITHGCEAGKVSVRLHRIHDGTKSAYTMRALVLRLPTQEHQSEAADIGGE